MSQREKKSLWILESKRLQRECTLLQSNIASNATISDASKHIDELPQDFVVYEAGLRKRVGFLKKHISGFIKGIKNIVASGGNLQSILEDIEKKITNHSLEVKSEQEKLSFEEEGLTEELQDFEINILNTLIDDGLSSKIEKSEGELQKERTKYRKKVDQDIIVRTRLGSIDKKLALLGRYGGWDVRDHDTFLKIWTQNDVQYLSIKPTDQNGDGNNDNGLKYDQVDEYIDRLDEYISSFSVSNRDQIIRKSIKQIPGVMFEDVDNHISWYIKVSILNKEKKKIVDNWKKDKRINEQLVLSHEIATLGADNNDIHDTDGDENFSMEAKIAETMKKKEQIALWKKQKELEKIQHEVEKKMEDDLIAKKREIERKQYQQAIKFQLEKWNEENPKSARDRKDVSKRLLRAKSADPAGVRARQERDLQIGLGRREKTESKLREKQTRMLFQKHGEEKISSDVKAMPSNPERAISSTRSTSTAAISKEQLDSIAAERVQTSAHRAAMPLSARDLGVGGGMRRAVPAWVRGAGM